MLERTAGCLESGSLRRLLPVSRKSVRTRRTLHSGFWNHGTGDTEIYPLWALMVHGAESSGQQQECQQLSISSNGMLDFLYPAATLNFIRKYSSWGADNQEGRWVRPWLGRAGCRGYTSSAKRSGTIDHAPETDITEQLEGGIEMPMHEDMGVLYEKLGLQKDIDFEEAWRQYSLLRANEQTPLRKLMIRYLCESERIVDAERVTELFESLDRSQRDQNIYQHAIRSSLKLRNLADAMQLYGSAVEHLRTPAGSDDILNYHLSNQSWSRAFTFWKSVQELCSESAIAAKYDIYKSLEIIPKLDYQTLRLAKFVNREIESFVNSTEMRSIDLSKDSAIHKDPRHGGQADSKDQHGFSSSVALVSDGSEDSPDGRTYYDFLVSVESIAGVNADPLPERHEAEELYLDGTTLSSTVVVDGHGVISPLEELGAMDVGNDQELPSLVNSSHDPKMISPEASSNDAVKTSQRPFTDVFADDVLAAHTDLIQFASDIVNRVLFGSQAFNSSIFIRLLQYFHKWQLDTPSLYAKAISKLFESHNTNLILICYKMAHRTKGFYMSRRTLNTVLSTFCAKHDAAGIKLVLDDFFSLHARPDRLAYRMCLTEFSRQGDVQTVHALFEQYCSRYLNKSTQSDFKGQAFLKGQADTADEFVPVLHVHARRGEVSEVKKILEQIEGLYGMQPTIKCWNILLSAYSKTQEFDKAFDCFERLVNDPNLRPNSYTMGTIMGMCASHGDLERTKEIYDLAQQLKIEETTPMIDALVLAYIRDGKLEEAQEICLETTARLDVKGSKTRMWNYILLEYAMRRDLESVNRVIQRMADLDIEFNEYTYAMLMQALAMVGQPDQAWKILKEVMREAGLRPSNFHYAIVMGGYITNRSYRNVFSIRAKMRSAGFKDSASTSQLEMKASVLFNKRRFPSGTVDEQLRQALEIFAKTMSSMDMQDIAETPRKGDGGLPLNIAYPTMFYNYIIFVLSSCKEFAAAGDAYEAYRTLLPEATRDPISILTAMMSNATRQKQFDKVEHFWSLAFSEAIERGRPLRRRGSNDDANANIGIVSGKADVLPHHQLSLSRPFRIYMRYLIQQRRPKDLSETVKKLIEAGFVMDNRNWNSYIVSLARLWRYPKDAFTLCESQLMPRWTGWSQIRWQGPDKNRLPVQIYRTKYQGRYTRPMVSTLLWLSRAFLDLQARAAEDTRAQAILDDIKRECPLTTRAITTRPRLDNTLERAILEGY